MIWASVTLPYLSKYSWKWSAYGSSGDQCQRQCCPDHGIKMPSQRQSKAVTSHQGLHLHQCRGPSPQQRFFCSVASAPEGQSAWHQSVRRRCGKEGLAGRGHSHIGSSRLKAAAFCIANLPAVEYLRFLTHSLCGIFVFESHKAKATRLASHPVPHDDLIDTQSSAITQREP